MATLREHLGHRSTTTSDPRPVVETTDRPVVTPVEERHDPVVVDRDADTRGPVETPRTETPQEAVREEYEQRVITRRARTSAAATFALVFGLAALFCSVVAIFAPVGVLLGIVGVILGVGSWRATAHPGVTGRTLGVAGLVAGLAAIVLGAAVVLGATTVLNDRPALDRMEQRLQQLRDQLPTVNVDVNR